MEPRGPQGSDPSIRPAPAGRLSGWDDHATACRYEAFCRSHRRYQDANAALVRHAELEPGQRVLDLGAGTGLTAESALPCLGPDGRIVCVEPAAAMRAVGEARLLDRRVSWSHACPRKPAVFDRILCGAAIWQMLPLERTFTRLAGLLAPRGALCFNIPSLYLGEPDQPGGGRDPLLLELPALLCPARNAAPDGVPPPDGTGVETRLVRAGLRPRRWTFRLRLSQVTYRDWLKIPVLTDWMLSGLDPDERARRIDEAFLQVDPDSWRWERWSGWTAWKLPGES
jgi:SAM-dependent methyltransferase